MSWLGQNGASRDDFMGLADAYASMYKAAEEADETQEELDEKVYSGNMAGNDKMPASHGNAPAPKKKPAVKNMPEELELLAALQDAYSMMYEKKKDSDKCGEGTYWDSEEKKCKKKKSSSKTVIVGRGGYYGGGHHHGGSNGGGDGDGGDTDGGDGGETGGGDGGGGGE